MEVNLQITPKYIYSQSVLDANSLRGAILLTYLSESFADFVRTCCFKTSE